MKLRLLVVLLSIAILAIGSSFFAVSANAVDNCKGVQAETHDPDPKHFWSIGHGGEWRVVHFWTNAPNHDQSLKKVALSPRDSVALLGGGNYWYWPKGCDKQALAGYRNDGTALTATALELAQQGLVRLDQLPPSDAS